MHLEIDKRGQPQLPPTKWRGFLAKAPRHQFLVVTDDVYPLLIRLFFPVNEVGWRIAGQYLFSAAGMALGGWVGGVAFDVAGSYAPAFVAALAFNAINFSSSASSSSAGGPPGSSRPPPDTAPALRRPVADRR